MKLSEIEVTVPVGRTERGKTITVIDLLQAFEVATGTRIGSTEFDKALANPAQLHARETIENSTRYRSLRNLLQSASDSGTQDLSGKYPSGLQRIAVEGSKTSGGRHHVRVSLDIEHDEDCGVGLDEALDVALASNSQPPQGSTL